jgi:hypothetical protein
MAEVWTWSLLVENPVVVVHLVDAGLELDITGGGEGLSSLAWDRNYRWFRLWTVRLVEFIMWTTEERNA